MADNTSQAPHKRSKKKPQEVLSAFWDKFHAKHPGKVTSIFPRSLYCNVLPPVDRRGARSARNAAESYDAAANECREAIARIRRECIRTNEKFTDPDFDIEGDDFYRNCLQGLVRPGDGSTGDGDDGTRAPMDMPGTVKRLDWVFEAPQFTIKGYSSSDIQQGSDGDCWWLAAVATIAHRKDLMSKVCVDRDEQCGAYGFVFYRDGEWASVVVDDNLYLTDGDYASDNYNDASGKKARQWRERQQTGSEALYFSHCEDPNETWLPLLEKAYAKAHGDYEAIEGGYAGQGVEDMTGGVSTTLVSNRVFNKDKLWDELPKGEDGDGEFVFALSASWAPNQDHKSGVALCHAYSILQARKEFDDQGNVHQLVKIRNPWGRRGYDGMGEWNGPWSDGSKEWTPYWLKKLGHTFGDDGVFWMSYKDMLETFSLIHRTRLFDREWTVVQQWTSADVSWITGYLPTKFGITIHKAGTVVIVLSQLDDRYFRGFEGEYWFELHFVLQAAGARPGAGEHICRVRPAFKWDRRSVSCEVDLAPGEYEVLPKITATRHPRSRPVEDVVRQYAELNPQKLRQVGMSYDLAHAKGGVPDEDALLEQKKTEARKKKEQKKQKDRKKKALARAARHVKEAQDALSEAVKSEDKAAPSDAVAGEKALGSDAAAGEKTLGSTVQGSSNNQQPTPEPEPEPVTGDASGVQPAPGHQPGKDAPPAEQELEPKSGEANGDDAATRAEKEKEKEKEKGNEEEKADATEDEDESEESSESDDDSDDEGPELSPWNAVAVIGLRVYARDSDVAISLVKPTEMDEVTSLTVDGKPAGPTI